MAKLDHIKTFSEVIEEYEFTHRQVSVRADYYNKLIGKGWKIPSAGSYYNFTTPTLAFEGKNNLLREIDNKYIMELAASCEAKCVYYFKKIVKRTSTIGLLYKSEVKGSVRNGSKPLMMQHLFPIFKQIVHPVDSVAYSEFKNLVEMRHWLAHGRSWELPMHLEKFDFSYSWQVTEEFLAKMSDFPASLLE